MTGSRVDEHRPLLLLTSPKARDVAITIHDEDEDDDIRSSTASVFRYTSFRASPSSSLAAVSPKFYQQQAQQQSPLLNRKYVTYPIEDVVGQKRSRTKVAVAVYGTMPVKTREEEAAGDDDDDKHSKMTTLRSLLCKMDDPRKKSCSTSTEATRATNGPCSNQSETESDSDGSCGSNTASSSSASSSSSSLQSILRIRDGIYACRKARKQVSVEFSLDVDHDDKDDAEERRKSVSSKGLLCASNCMPRYVKRCFLSYAMPKEIILTDPQCVFVKCRRLTIEEKAALYRIRPDLQLTPMPLILRELEEIRRRRQRKLMFSVLGGTLILLMIIVFYYLLTETP